MTALVKEYADRLWQRISASNHLSGEEESRYSAVYYQCLRHLFIPKYVLNGEMRTFDPMSETDLAMAYSDRPVLLFESSSPKQVCTISQPSFVFYLLKALAIEVTDRVFELGGGSGWNAALMAALATEGHVVSVEIIDDMVPRARASVDGIGIKNVTFIQGDGMEQTEEGAVYDKGIFTASATDFPLHFFRSVRGGGRVFFVFNITSGLDLGVVLERNGDAFESVAFVPCAFVPVTGSTYALNRDLHESEGEVLLRIETLIRNDRDLLRRVRLRVLPREANSPATGGDYALIKRANALFHFEFP